MTVFAQVQIDENQFREADAQLARLPLELRTNVLPKGLRAAAAPVEKKARQLAPDSEKSGSRRKWSRKVRQKRASTKPHKQTIGHSTVRRYKTSDAIYVGPVHPQGNLINVIGHNHNQVQWGNRTGWIVQPTTYLQEAAQQTKAQQQTAFVDKVRSESDKLLNSMGSGK
jgi:hypothetical protein